MALISKQKYDQGKMDKLAEYLRIYHQKDQPLDYEIIVDGLKVVRRTNDPDMFPMYENFVTADTKSIEILFYVGTSNVNDKHIFTLIDEPKEQGLSGIEIDNRIQEKVDQKVDQHKKDLEYEALKKDNKDLQEEVDELEKEVEKLEKEKEDFIKNQSPLKGYLGEIGSSFVESFIRRNPNVIKNIPGGETLAGLLNTDAKPEGGQPENAEVSFQPKTKTTSLSEEDQAAITFVNQLKSQFSKDEFDKILLILQTLADDKSKIDLILNHVNIKQG